MPVYPDAIKPTVRADLHLWPLLFGDSLLIAVKQERNKIDIKYISDQFLEGKIQWVYIFDLWPNYDYHDAWLFEQWGFHSSVV